MVKNLPANAGDTVQFQGQEDPLEEEMAHHSSILTWKIPWTAEPGGLQSMDWRVHGHKESDTAERPTPHALSKLYPLPFYWKPSPEQRCHPSSDTPAI